MGESWTSSIDKAQPHMHWSFKKVWSKYTTLPGSIWIWMSCVMKLNVTIWQQAGQLKVERRHCHMALWSPQREKDYSTVNEKLARLYVNCYSAWTTLSLYITYSLAPRPSPRWFIKIDCGTILVTSNLLGSWKHNGRTWSESETLFWGQLCFRKRGVINNLENIVPVSEIFYDHEWLEGRECTSGHYKKLTNSWYSSYRLVFALTQR